MNTPASSISSTGSSILSDVTRPLSDLGKVSGGPTAFVPFSRAAYVAPSATRDFLKSNSLVARFAFLLMVIIGFVVLLRVGIWIMGALFSPSPSPILIDGMIDSRNMMVIPQDPNVSGAKPILRSVNQKDGLEFTWSVWIYVDDFHYKEGQYRHIFHKGNDNINYNGENSGLNFPNNGPGLYLAPNKNDIVVMMNSFDKIKEEIVVKDIPLKKWVNIMIRCDGKILDVFVNGTLSRRHELSSVPKQNYGDVYVSMNGGFMGNTASLRYFNHSLSVGEIQSIVMSGPNTKMVASSNGRKKPLPHYLSTRWFLMGNEDGYNPLNGFTS